MEKIQLQNRAAFVKALNTELKAQGTVKSRVIAEMEQATDKETALAIKAELEKIAREKDESLLSTTRDAANTYLSEKGWKADGTRGQSEATLEQEAAGEAAALEIANGDALRTDEQGGKTAHVAATVGAYVEAAVLTAIADCPADKIGSKVVTVVRRTAKSDALATIVADLVGEYQKVQPTSANDDEKRIDDGIEKAALAADAINKSKRGRRKKAATAKA